MVSGDTILIKWYQFIPF